MRKPYAIHRQAMSGCVYCLLALFPAVVMAATPGSVLNRLAVPDNTTLAIVTTDALHNGAPIAMATLTSSESVDSVLAFYQTLWSDGDESLPGYIESAFENQQLISRLRDGVNIVIQLENTGSEGAFGYVSVMALNAPPVSEDHGPFSDMQTLSSNRSVDGVDTSWMRVYASASSVSQTHDNYLQRLKADGWHVLSDNEVQGEVQGAWMTQLGRDTSRLEVSFLDSREFASVVVVHEVISK